MNGTTRLVAALGAHAAAGRALHPAVPRHAPPRGQRPRRRSAPSTSTAMTACLPSARRWPQVYRRWGWGQRVFVWHEAADTRLFRPPAQEGQREGLVWIGNWGDGERSAGAGELPAAARAGAPACRSTSMACATPRRRCAPLARAWRALSRLAAECPGARGLRPPSRDGACAAALLRGAAARHPHHPRLRGAGLRHPAGLARPGTIREGLFRPGEDYLVARGRGGDDAAFAWRCATTRRCAPRLPRTASRPSARATPARIARGVARHPGALRGVRQRSETAA